MNDAERILVELGINDPGDIDLELIAFSMDLQVRYGKLQACEARLVGLGDKGIITVRSDAHPRRKRFSVAHEIGHWIYHRNKALLCKARDIEEIGQASKAREKKANDFAGELLLPRYLFDPELASIRRLTADEIVRVADLFDVSITATARRIVASGSFPSILIAYRRTGRAWFVKSPTVPDRWFPSADLHPDAGAFDMLFANRAVAKSKKSRASVFFERPEASSFFVREENLRIQSDFTLTLLSFDDPKALAN